jgi:HEAT repeat protein
MELLMSKNKILQGILYLGAIGISIGMLFFVVTCTIIGYEVKELCADAKAEYNGECVESLISLLDDENQSFRSRNSAIWALGQLGDARALPALERYYTGNIPQRKSLAGGISQYELKKAIKLAGGGLNQTVWAWDADLLS